MTKLLPCPECGNTCLITLGADTDTFFFCTDRIACENGHPPIYVEDNTLPMSQLVALWNERCIKILKSKEESVGSS